MKSSISVGEMAFDWCKMSSDRYLQHCHLAFINVFDELLFRQQHEPTRYLKWAQEGLLLSKKMNCKDEAVDLTVIQTMEIFWILYAEMKKKCNQTGFVAALLKTFEQTKDDVELKEIICCTKPLIKQIPINNIAPNWTDLQRNTALTILLAHFADYIKKFADEGDSLLNDFEQNCECNNQKIEHLQWKGEDEVSISEFTAAILTYSKAVEMSPYNHHLYCRRAYCYLQLNDHRTAILDSIRATVLKPDYFKDGNKDLYFMKCLSLLKDIRNLSMICGNQFTLHSDFGESTSVYAKGHYFCAKGLLSAGYPDYALVVNRRGIDLCLVGGSDITVLQEQRSEIQEEMKKKGNCETTQEQHSSSKKATVVGGDDSPVPEPGSDTDIESLEGEESVGDFRGEKFQAAWENLIDNLTETNCKVFDELPEESETSIESQKSTPRTEKTNSCEELPPDPTEQYEEENSSRKISEPRSADKIVFDPSKCRLWRAVHSEQDLITQGVEDISFLLYRLKLKKFLSEGDREEVEKQSTGPSKLDALLRIVLKKNSNLEIRKFTSVLVAIDGLKPELSKWVQNLEEMGNSCADSFLYLYLEVLAEPLNGIPLRDLIYSLQTRNILTDVENDLLMKTSPVHRGQRLLEVIVYMKSAAEKAEFVFLLEEERRSFPTLRKCLDEFQQEFEKLRDGYIPRFKRYMPLKRLRRREDLPADERNSYCNFFRLMYLIILEGTRMAQKVFAERVPPSDLQAEIRKLKKAELHRHFREFQATFASHSDWGLLYPQKASRLEFQKYDVTLIVFLMMHVKSFPQPRKGWRTEPPPDDHSKPASLLRLLYLRRRLVLRDGYLGVPEEEFLAMWSEAKQCLCWLGKDHEEIEDIMFTPGYLLWRDHKLIAELMGRQCSEMTGQYMMAMKAHLQTKTKEVMKMGETKAEPPPGGKENPAPATGTATPDRKEKEADTGGEGEIALGQDATEKENSLSFQVTVKGEGSSRPSETQCANDPQRNSRKKKKKKTKGKKKSAVPVENVSEKDVESTADEDRDEDVSQASHQDLRGKNELAELEAAVRRWQLLCEEKSSQYEQLLKRQSKTLESCKQQTAEVQRLKQEMENERKMQQNDKKVLQNQIKNLQEVLQSKEELVKKSEKQIQAQEQELQQQKKQAQQEQDQWTQEKSRLERQSAKSKDEFIEAMRRAMAAEVQVLECRRDKATAFLEQAAKEGEVKLSGLRQKLMSGPAVQIDVKAAIMAYEMVLADIKSKIHQTVSAFNEQIDLIRNGAKLSNMPQVPVVLPPSQSDFMLIYMTKQKELLASSGFPANNNSQGTTSTLPAFPPGMAPLNNQLGITQRSMSPGLPTQPSSLGPANPSQGGTSNQNHLERLLEKLTELFPQHNRDMMIVFLRQVRMMNNNSLSGLSFEQIISQVSVLIKNHQPHLGNVNLDFASLPTDPMSSTGTWRNVSKDPHVNRLGFMSGLSHQSGVGTEPGHQKDEEDPCVICQEELTSSRLFVMKCGHKYHRECISLWLKDQKTCPSCTLSFATSFSQS